MVDGVTIKSAAVTLPFDSQQMFVWLKEDWSDTWALYLDISVETVSRSSAATGSGNCTLSRQYGSVMNEYNSTYAAQEPLYIDNWWVKVAGISEQRGNMFFEGTDPIEEDLLFIGRVTTETRLIEGGDTATSGKQTWTVYGPGQTMRKTWVYQSKWYDDDDTIKTMGWIPSMNSRDEKGRLFGNMSVFASEGTFLYGTGREWDRYEYAVYIITHFMDQTGPEWGLGGQIEVLKSAKDIIEFDEVESVWSILRKLINPTIGMDFHIIPYGDGFTVWVFSLISEEQTYGDKTLTSNPDKIRLENTSADDVVDIIVSKNTDHRFAKIRVIGERIIVLKTLFKLPNLTSTLETKWDTALQTEYDAGGGLTSAFAKDLFRDREKYRNVYTTFGAKSSVRIAAPVLRKDGTLGEDENGIVSEVPEEAEGQIITKKTLDWLPLQEGFDYTNGIQNNNPEGYVADYKKPVVWMYTPPIPGVIDEGYWVAADKGGITINALENEWGLMLKPADANHEIADNHFDENKATGIEPYYDYDFMTMTIAVETDQRLVIEHALTNDDDGTVLDIFVKNAHFWYMPENTSWETDAIGLFWTNWETEAWNSQPLVLRNDAPNLYLVMAGAIARYFNSRGYGRLEINRYVPWGDFVGYILTVVDEDGDTFAIQAPITNVSWTNGRTIISTGYAS